MSVFIIITLFCCLHLKIGLVESQTIDSVMMDAMKAAQAKSGVIATDQEGVKIDMDGTILAPGTNVHLTELDIALPDHMSGVGRFTRATINPQQYRWKDNTVPYELSSGFNATDVEDILHAMNDWEMHTCITFREKRAGDIDYITIQSLQSGCWAYPGRQGGEQYMNLQPGSPGCVYNYIIVHEIGHVLGLRHEQSRSDRDDYVDIHWSNLNNRGSVWKNFLRFDNILLNSLQIPYDYLSDMHYGKSAAGKPGTVTIETHDPAFQDRIGRVPTLSFRDAAAVSEMHECAASCGGITYNPPSPGNKEYYVSWDCKKYCPDSDGFGIVQCADETIVGSDGNDDD